MSVGKRLKRARLEARLTLEKSAELVNTNFNTIWRYEAGQRRPSGPTLYALATLYGKPVEWFFGGEEQGSEPLPEEHLTQQLAAFTWYAESNRTLSATALVAKLTLKYDDPASESTVQRWIRGWTEQSIEDDSPFDWSQIGKQGDLPWESGGYLMRMLAFVLEGKHDWFLTNASTVRPQRITFRQAKWCWRVHMAAPELCLFDVFWVAHNCSLRELVGDLEGHPFNMEDIQAFLAYRPWAGEDKYDAYHQATTNGTIPSLPDSGKAVLDVNIAVRFFETSTPQVESIIPIGGLLFSETLALLMVKGDDRDRAERLMEGLPPGYFRDPEEFGVLSGNNPAIQENFVVDSSQDGYVFDFTQLSKYERKKTADSS